MIQQRSLSNLQVELLKVFSHDLDESDLVAIQRMLANYFAEKATAAFDEVWDSEGWSNETMDAWARGES